jgi:hypothetical protein
MKYISYWEYCPEDARKVIEKFKKRSDLKIKTLYGPCHVGLETKGFTIFEADSSEVLADYASYYIPVLSMKIYPINDSSQMVISWEKYNK